jgi:hypothetical protein
MYICHCEPLFEQKFVVVVVHPLTNQAPQTQQPTQLISTERKKERKKDFDDVIM